ncbi:MAG: transposase [Anaeromyxobacter sp.]
MPLYRQAKAYRRVGVQVDDSTLGDLFHRTAEILNPLYERLLKLVSEKEIVLADETTLSACRRRGRRGRPELVERFIGRDELESELHPPTSSPKQPIRRDAGEGARGDRRQAPSPTRTAATTR